MQTEEIDDRGDVKSKAVPWYDWNEWLHVKKQIFSQDKHQINHAITRMYIWKKRNSQIPHTVQCTYDILLCITKQMNEMAMGTVVVRFVNGFLESTQKEAKGRYKESISVIMSKLNIPKAVVDVRHSVSHGDMPSYSHILHTVQLCFKWLCANYWDKQEQHLLRDASAVTLALQEMRQLLLADPETTHAKKLEEIQNQIDQRDLIVQRIMFEDVYSYPFHLQHFVMNDLLQENLMKKNALIADHAQRSIILFKRLQDDSHRIIVHIIRILLISALECAEKTKLKLCIMWLSIILHPDYLSQIIGPADLDSPVQTQLQDLLARQLMVCRSKTQDESNMFAVLERLIRESAYCKHSNTESKKKDEEWELCSGDAKQIVGLCEDTTSHTSTILLLPEGICRKRLRTESSNSSEEETRPIKRKKAK